MVRPAASEENKRIGLLFAKAVRLTHPACALPRALMLPFSPTRGVHAHPIATHRSRRPSSRSGLPTPRGTGGTCGQERQSRALQGGGAPARPRPDPRERDRAAAVGVGGRR